MFLINFVFISGYFLSLFWLFLISRHEEIISGRSQRYSAVFADSLRGKLRTTNCADGTDVTDGPWLASTETL